MKKKGMSHCWPYQQLYLPYVGWEILLGGSPKDSNTVCLKSTIHWKLNHWNDDIHKQANKAVLIFGQYPHVKCQIGQSTIVACVSENFPLSIQVHASSELEHVEANLTARKRACSHLERPSPKSRAICPKIILPSRDFHGLGRQHIITLPQMSLHRKFMKPRSQRDDILLINRHFQLVITPIWQGWINFRVAQRLIFIIC